MIFITVSHYCSRCVEDSVYRWPLLSNDALVIIYATPKGSKIVILKYILPIVYRLYFDFEGQVFHNGTFNDYRYKGQVIMRSNQLNQLSLGYLWLFTLLLLLLAIPLISPANTTIQTTSDHLRQAQANFTRGYYQSAIEHWMLALSDINLDTNRKIKLWHQLGQVYIATGRLTKAIKSLQAAIAMANNHSHSPTLAKLNISLATALYKQGQHQAATTLLNKAIKLAAQGNHQAIEIAAQNTLGIILAKQGKTQPAINLYSQLLLTIGKKNNPNLMTKLYVNIARIYLTKTQISNVVFNLEKATLLINKLADTADKADLAIRVGKIYAEIETLTGNNAYRLDAYRALRQGALVAGQWENPRQLALAYGEIGALYEKQQRIDEALYLTEQAIQKAQQAHIPSLLYRWQWQAGRLLTAQGNTPAAIESYQRAIFTLQPIRDILSSGSFDGREFRQHIGPLYLALANLLIQRALNQPERALAQQDLIQVRDTIESFKAAELADYFQDDCVANLQAKTTGIDRLEAHTAAIYPIILPERLAILLSLPTGMKLHLVEVTADTFNQEVNQLRHQLEKRTTRQYLRHAKQIYQWLIQPLQAELTQAKIQTLVMIPDGSLRTIPIATLHDGKQFLVENYALATTPGLTLTDPKPLKTQQANIMINGLTEAVQGFTALPQVNHEITTVRTLFNSTVLQDKDYLLSNVETLLQNNTYSIVHIASHAQFSSDINKTFLLTYDDKLTLNKLEQLLTRTRYRQNPIELLTLSACQTAAGDDRAALGLAGLAVKAGARSALATLWFINDEASSLLISDFYQQLRQPTTSKAKALQQAQLQIMADNRYQHPAYWAPFLLIGNWL